MLNQEQIDRIQPKLVLVQAVAAALILGALGFAAMISVIVDWENLNDQTKMLTMIAGATGVFIFVMSIFVPKIFANKPTAAAAVNSPIEDKDIDAALPMMMTETLIRYALIEGGIFLNAMVMIIEPHLASLIVAGTGLLLMLVLFPLQSKMIATTERRARSIRP